MSIGLIFWVLMLVALVYGGLSVRGGMPAWGGSLLTFILFLLLGWGVFGAPIQG